jgi:hypothetical protein
VAVIRNDLESADLLAGIHDERARHVVLLLLNLVEELSQENRTLRGENQRLRDENQRLKGEQGRPAVKGNKARSPTLPASGNYSSEQERRQPQFWSKSSKQDRIVADREQVLKVDPALLPADAEFKGYEHQVAQDIVLRTDNVLFHREQYYSPSESKSYLAPLPAGYSSQFGHGLRALTLVLYFGGLMSEANILKLYRSVGLQLSEGWLSDLLVHQQQAFHAERDAVLRAGLESSPWQHSDDTPTRVNGQNQYCQVRCNPLYTAYRTLPNKDRLSVLMTLAHWEAPRFRITEVALAYLEQVGVAQWVLAAVAALPQDQEWDRATFGRLLDEEVPKLGVQQRRWVEEAAAVAAYRAQTDWPVVRLLACDDAPQTKGLTEDLALCWIHEGRHYNKLIPYFAEHQRLIEDFRGRFWEYYRELLAYRERPSTAERARLERRFDELFATVTGYDALDDRIAKTAAKRRSLLRVLDHPELPLHNNPAELGARQRVRKRDVSFGPRTPEGAKAWDTFQTLAETARKLGVSFYHYVYDTITQAYRLPRLADLIAARAQELNLGASWATA